MICARIKAGAENGSGHGVLTRNDVNDSAAVKSRKSHSDQMVQSNCLPGSQSRKRERQFQQNVCLFEVQTTRFFISIEHSEICIK